MGNSSTLITLQDIMDARSVLEGHVHRTPLVGSKYLSDRTGVKVLLKLESFQKTGSFKVRGVLNKLQSLTDAEKKRGVITFSAGNHAQSLAYAASLWDISSTLVMPATALRSKIEATEEYGGTVRLADGDLLETTLSIQREHGQTMVHSFDDLKIIAGAGTVGHEILDELPDVDMIVAGVGGGGLLSGIATAAKLSNPRIRVVGVEPRGADAMSRSIAQGSPERLTEIKTVADGLAAPFAGVHNLAHFQKFVDDVVLVSDQEILGAMVVVMERCKLVVEPAAAACIAALTSGKISLDPGSTVACIISGGNVGAKDLVRLLSKIE